MVKSQDTYHFSKKKIIIIITLMIVILGNLHYAINSNGLKKRTPQELNEQT